MSQRVLVAGMGAISAAGGDITETLDCFAAGRRNVGRVTLFATPLDYPVFEVRRAVEFRKVKHTAWLPQSSGKYNSRIIQLVLMALDEALANAGLHRDLAGRRVGVCMGTTVASQLNDMAFYKSFRETGSPPMESVASFLKGNLAEAVAAEVQAAGPCITVVNACSSSADAIGVACSWLRAGLCDLAIAGGGDELNRIPLCGFGSLGVFSRQPCRPYDRDRDGLNLGEGAGVLILETEDAARARGAASNLFIAGYGAACDAYHLTAPRPDGDGLETAVRLSLAEAGIQPAQICFVNAHGTATRENDKVEGNVLARIFGVDVKVLSTKGYTGHTLGASGALAAIFTALALREGWIPASAGFENKDDEIPVGAVRARTAIAGQYAAATSLAFGGNNASVVVGRLA